MGHLDHDLAHAMPSKKLKKPSESARGLTGLFSRVTGKVNDWLLMRRVDRKLAQGRALKK